MENRSSGPRLLEEYRGFSCPPPGKHLCLSPADVPPPPPHPPHFSFPGEAVYRACRGLPPPSVAIFNRDCLNLYGGPAAGVSPRQNALPRRGFPGRAAGLPADSARSPPGRTALPPPGFDRREEGVHPGRGAGEPEEKEARRRSERTGRESGEVRAGSESPPAGKDGEEEPLLSSRSRGDGGGYAKSCERRKKKRCPYTKLQIRQLENEFLSSVYITRDRRSRLSGLLQLTDRQVKIWFQNRRMKQKKLERERLQYFTHYALY